MLPPSPECEIPLDSTFNTFLASQGTPPGWLRYLGNESMHIRIRIDLLEQARLGFLRNKSLLLAVNRRQFTGQLRTNYGLR